MSEENNHLKRLIDTHQNYESEATLTLKEIESPKKYGVAEAEKEPDDDVYKINSAVEKPEKPPSNLAIMPIYIFEPSIFDALKETPPGKGDEIQLTDGFAKLIDWDRNVRGIKLRPEEARWDIGTSGTYWEALKESYNYAQSQMEKKKE